MSKEMNWKQDLWDALSDQEMRNKIQNLPNEVQVQILKNFSGTELKRIGWEEVCLGCGKNVEQRDCGCPAGTGWRPPKREKKNIYFLREVEQALRLESATKTDELETEVRQRILARIQRGECECGTPCRDYVAHEAVDRIILLSIQKVIKWAALKRI